MLLECMSGVEVERVLVTAEVERIERCSLAQLSPPRIRLASAKHHCDFSQMTDLTHASLRRTLKISFSFRLSAFSFLRASSKASKDFCGDIISALASNLLHLVLSDYD
jgi:epoxyqueuosine reductase QueG